jgi:hypothetical protein
VNATADTGALRDGMNNVASPRCYAALKQSLGPAYAAAEFCDSFGAQAWGKWVASAVWTRLT